jgi:penicillin-binding protein 2
MISPASWELVVKAMVGVTSSAKPLGTAYWQMRGSPYAIAGKTGTAQLVRESANGASSERDYAKDKTLERLRDDAWFIAFAPAEAPRIAVAVLVEHAGWGDLAAAPIARKVLDAYLLGPDGKLLPAAPRGPYSEPTDLKPRIEPSVPALPAVAPAVQQIADQPRASRAPSAQ